MMDAHFTDHGSVWLCEPLTPAAHDWVETHIPGDAQWFGASFFAIEPRYVWDIVDGMTGAGSEVGQ
jgi:hypothetical protein